MRASCVTDGTWLHMSPRDSLNSGPHAGAIDVILSDKENGLVISGGDDGGAPRPRLGLRLRPRSQHVRGFLRWWPIDEIDSAEADYDNGILESRSSDGLGPSWKR